MDHTRFVLLQEPIAATEARNLLCHVVASKSAPQLAHAPFNADNAPTHSTVSLAVPKCRASIKLGSFMILASDQGVGPRVSRLLNLANLPQEELQISQEFRTVKRYTLESPQPAFQQLMKSAHYSKEVRSLLEACLPHRVYFVTGFLTATDDSWLIGAAPAEINHPGNIVLPYGDDVAVPVPFLYDAIIGQELSTLAQPCHQTSYLANEQIFAVSYKAVNISRESTPFQRHLSPTPAHARPRRSNAYHLASSRANETWVQQQASRALHGETGMVVLIDDETHNDITSEDDLFIIV